MSAPTLCRACRLLREMLSHEDSWAFEYVRRERLHAERQAWREVAHYEDLINAHQNHAAKIRQVLELLKT